MSAKNGTKLRRGEVAVKGKAAAEPKPVAEAKPKPESGPKAKPEKKTREPKPARHDDNLVVFAIRLTEAERDAIHKAAGPGKATKLVRAVVNAAATGDEAAFRQAVKEAAERQKK